MLAATSTSPTPQGVQLDPLAGYDEHCKRFLVHNADLVWR